eukprot:scaffold114373_cov70-Phaeocystis_antarctica.AAC.2
MPLRWRYSLVRWRYARGTRPERPLLSETTTQPSPPVATILSCAPASTDSSEVSSASKSWVHVSSCHQSSSPDMRAARAPSLPISKQRPAQCSREPIGLSVCARHRSENGGGGALGTHRNHVRSSLSRARGAGDAFRLVTDIVVVYFGCTWAAASPRAVKSVWSPLEIPPRRRSLGESDASPARSTVPRVPLALTQKHTKRLAAASPHA